MIANSKIKGVIYEKDGFGALFVLYIHFFGDAD